MSRDETARPPDYPLEIEAADLRPYRHSNRRRRIARPRPQPKAGQQAFFWGRVVQT